MSVDSLFFFFFLSFPLHNRKRCIFWSLQKSFTRSKSLTPFFFFFLIKRWQNFKLAILLPGILHIRRFLKKLRSRRVPKKKAVKAVDVYIWILFYVTYQRLHHRLRLEASAAEEGFDAALFFCCKKERKISGDKNVSCNKLRNVIKKPNFNKKKNQLSTLAISFCN